MKFSVINVNSSIGTNGVDHKDITFFSPKLTFIEIAQKLIAADYSAMWYFILEVQPKVFDSMLQFGTLSPKAVRGVQGKVAWIMPLQFSIHCTDDNYISQIVHKSAKNDNPMDILFSLYMPFQSTPFTHSQRYAMVDFASNIVLASQNSFMSETKNHLKLLNKCYNSADQACLKVEMISGTIFSTKVENSKASFRDRLEQL